MDDAVTDRGKPGLAADMVGEPVVDCGNRGTVIFCIDRLIDELAALRVGNLEPWRDPDALDLAVRPRRKRLVILRPKHRKLDARRPGIDDKDQPARLTHHLRLTSRGAALTQTTPTA